MRGININIYKNIKPCPYRIAHTLTQYSHTCVRECVR